MASIILTPDSLACMSYATSTELLKSKQGILLSLCYCSHCCIQTCSPLTYFLIPADLPQKFYCIFLLTQVEFFFYDCSLCNTSYCFEVAFECARCPRLHPLKILLRIITLLFLIHGDIPMHSGSQDYLFNSS